MNRHLLGILAAAVLFPFGSASAEPTAHEALSGLKEFRLTISLDADAQACGVVRERIEAAILPILGEAKLRLNAGARTRLGARVHTTRVAERVCAFAFALEVVPRVTIADTGVTSFAPVWARQAVTCGPISAAQRLVSDVFQHAARELVADWARANSVPRNE
jgi:hypothetical protein